MPEDNNISCFNTTVILRQISVNGTNEKKALSGIRKQTF